MKYIMFSKTFPAEHPRKGEPTWFVQKILWSTLIMAGRSDLEPYPSPAGKIVKDLPKYHTIRGGFDEGRGIPLTRWEVGEIFSARIWEGKPYASKQSEFAQLQIKQIWDITIDANGVISMGKPGEQQYYISEEMEIKLANNDGLSLEDFQEWLVMPVFRKAKEWRGQIICWSDAINYDF